MDNYSVIHARSERLVKYFDKLAGGKINMAEMHTLIDKEEAAANICNQTEFFTSVRLLAQKVMEAE